MRAAHARTGTHNVSSLLSFVRVLFPQTEGRREEREEDRGKGASPVTAQWQWQQAMVEKWNTLGFKSTQSILGN